MPQRDPNLVTPTGLSQWLSGEESACNAEATGSIPGQGTKIPQATKIPWPKRKKKKKQIKNKSMNL